MPTITTEEIIRQALGSTINVTMPGQQSNALLMAKQLAVELKKSSVEMNNNISETIEELILLADIHSTKSVQFTEVQKEYVDGLREEAIADARSAVKNLRALSNAFRQFINGIEKLTEGK